MKILMTGGFGTLGTELRKHFDCVSFKHSMIDIVNTDCIDWLKSMITKDMLLVHCAAFTDLVRAENEKIFCYETNVIGTRNLANLGIPMIYISTEYVFDGQKGYYSEEDYPNPQNFYALTKLLGEYECLRNTAKSTVIRCLFKPRPFKHAQAIVDQFTSGDYVDVIAGELACAVRLFDKLPQILHIGGPRTTTYELAKRSRAVRPIELSDVKTVKLPRDTSLNCSKWKRIKHESGLC